MMDNEASYESSTDEYDDVFIECSDDVEFDHLDHE